jgi:TonB family protein
MKSVLCMALLLASTSMSAQDAGSEGRNALNRGVQAFRNGDPNTALGAFLEARQLDPNLTAADLYIATVYASMYVPGNTSPQNQEVATKAIAGFESFLAKAPGNADGWAGLAGMYQGIKEFQKARTAYRRVTELAPQNASAFYAVGAVDWILVADKVTVLPTPERNQLINEGLEAIDRALALNPAYEEAMAYKNLLLRQKAAAASDPVEIARLNAEAEAWFNKALETKKNNLVGRLATGGAPGSTSAAPPPPPPPPPPPQAISAAPIRVGGDVAQSNLIQRIQPQYPADARAARIQGVVLLQAIIDRSGVIADLKVISGHPILNASAIDAVRQWRYNPILLNGQPIEVITTISVNYSFQ